LQRLAGSAVSMEATIVDRLLSRGNRMEAERLSRLQTLVD
jgi:hypothetical protein